MVVKFLGYTTNARLTDAAADLVSPLWWGWTGNPLSYRKKNCGGAFHSLLPEWAKVPASREVGKAIRLHRPRPFQLPKWWLWHDWDPADASWSDLPVWGISDFTHRLPRTDGD